jgi:hypothetical protein
MKYLRSHFDVKVIFTMTKVKAQRLDRALACYPAAVSVRGADGRDKTTLIITEEGFLAESFPTLDF